VTENDPTVFARLPATPADRDVEGRPSRQEVVGFWKRRYGLSPSVFEGHSFWEKGAGKVWALAAAIPDRAPVEAVGIRLLRTRQEHWKPTTEACQRFGSHARANVCTLSPARARRFLRGERQPLARWDGDWGYLLVAHELAGAPEPIGVGLYLEGELRSQIPKGRRRDL
jgi:NOL1/NOP2/fmu family ribosome biogenesis protein